MVRGGASEIPDPVPLDSVPDADRVDLRAVYSTRPDHHFLDSLGIVELHVHAHQYVELQAQVAARHHPAGLQPSVPSAPGAHVAHSLRGDLLRRVSRLRAATPGNDGLLYRRLAVVRVLPLPVREARGAVHDALAEAGRLLRLAC